jgi:hypothetical protein
MRYLVIKKRSVTVKQNSLVYAKQFSLLFREKQPSIDFKINGFFYVNKSERCVRR